MNSFTPIFFHLIQLVTSEKVSSNYDNDNQNHKWNRLWQSGNHL